MPGACSINLQLGDRLCVVVGAGPVGRRKCRVFLDCGARVRLIDPRAEYLEPAGRLVILRRPYRAADLDGALLAVAATDRAELNRRIAADARCRGVLVSVSDDSTASDFSLPAVRQQGRLRLAVSSGGTSPALAGLVADRLAKGLEPGWPLALELAGRLREWQLTHPEQTAYNRSILRRLVEQGLVEELSAQRYDRVDQLLQKICGCSLAALGRKPPEGL